MVHQLRKPQGSRDVAQPVRRSILLVERGSARRAHRGGGVQGEQGGASNHLWCCVFARVFFVAHERTCTLRLRPARTLRLMLVRVRAPRACSADMPIIASLLMLRVHVRRYDVGVGVDVHVDVDVDVDIDIDIDVDFDHDVGVDVDIDVDVDFDS